MANRATELGTLAGKSPISLVAACLYLVSSLSANPRSAKEIADVAGCTEATLKNAYKLLYESRNELLPADFKFSKSWSTLAPP